MATNCVCSYDPQTTLIYTTGAKTPFELGTY